MRFAEGLVKARSILPGVVVVLLSACRQSSPALPDFADLVERVSPAVVNISAIVPDDEQGDDVADSGDDSESNSQMPEWLRRYLEQHGQSALPDQQRSVPDRASGNPPTTAPSNPSPNSSTNPPPDGSPGDGPDQADAPQSLGSGFVLSSDGYILTNQHVVKDAREIIVRLSDRRQMRAQVVGSDERSDLALLKIEATGLPAVRIGDTRHLRVGEWVLAIGSPFGFDYSVTAGIVSAKGRSLDTEQYVPFIQTDAAINPGNSGGPLFNLRGEVVGVNSQIYSQTGGFMGVAFSIPMDVATKVVRQLKEHGKVTRGWLGVVVQEVDLAQAQKLGMDKPVGALIARVIANSPAEQAGLRAGDVILRYDGAELATSADLPALVGNSDPGQTATLDMLRDHKQFVIRAEIGTLDDSALETAPEGPPLGLTVETPTEAQRRAAKIVSGGVRVTQVDPGPGRDAGVQVNDLLLSIAGQDVDSVERFAEVVDRLTPGQSVQLLVQRRGQPVFLQLAAPLKGKG